MRIGIEAQRLFRPHKHGMDRVVLELIKALQRLDKVNEYFIFVKPDVDRSVLNETENFKIVEIPGGPYPIWEQFRLANIAEQYQCDLLHCTSNTAPISLKIPLVTTMHDIIFKETSIIRLVTSRASWYQKIGNLYRRLILSRVMKNSDRLITVSNFEKQNILRNYSNFSKPIHTVYNGVSENFQNIEPWSQTHSIHQKFGLPDRYILHIGNTDPRKNTRGVLSAFYDYLSTSEEMSKLVIVGINESKLFEMLKELALPESFKNNIVCTGYVSDSDLPLIFKNAELFLFPSLREGFGIPIIEAMSCGVPVITSNTSSMPEVAGDAAYLVDPTHHQEISEAIGRVMTNRHLRKTMIDRGLKRHKQFSWSNSAQEVLDIYNNLYQQLN